jgi:transposase
LARADYVRRVLAPTLTSGDIVVIDNLGSHKSDDVRQAPEAGGATVRFLPPYCPNFNPIETSVAKKRSCEEPRPDRSTRCITQSTTSSAPSHWMNAQTSSPPADMIRSKPETL